MRTGTRRRIHEVLIACTLALTAGAAIYWYRGYWVHDGVAAWVAGRSVHLASFRGGFEFSAAVDTRGLGEQGVGIDYSSVPRGFVEQRWLPMRPQVEARRVELGGFVVALGRADRVYAHNGVWVPVRVVLPAWFVMLVLLLMSGVLRRRRRKLLRLERTAAGLCGTCGYDLRATPGRCPECGTGADRVVGRRIIRRLSGSARRAGVQFTGWLLIRPAGH